MEAAAKHGSSHPELAALCLRTSQRIMAEVLAGSTPWWSCRSREQADRTPGACTLDQLAREGAAVLLAAWEDVRHALPTHADRHIEQVAVQIGIDVLHAVAPVTKLHVVVDDVAAWLADEIDEWWEAARRVAAE